MNTECCNEESKHVQDQILLDIIKEICSEPKSQVSSQVQAKVNRIIADCDLKQHSSLHKLSTADETSSTLLGLMHQTPEELSYDEQSEFNQAVINKIQTKLPTYNTELEQLKRASCGSETRKEQIKELQKSMEEKLNTLEQQEGEKVDLMMQWINHRLEDVTKFSDNSSEFLTMKTRILELKPKILHLQILQNIFTETSQSVKSYSEIHKDLSDGVKEMERRIKEYRSIIENEL